MELKIRIKEFTDEVKPLTIEEQCMYSVANNSMYEDAYRDEVRRHLDKIGFIGCVYEGNVTGFFRTETIRDATVDEVIAWHSIQMHNEYDGLRGIFYGLPVFNTDDESHELLKNKEIILELV